MRLEYRIFTKVAKATRFFQQFQKLLLICKIFPKNYSFFWNSWFFKVKISNFIKNFDLEPCRMMCKTNSSSKTEVTDKAFHLGTSNTTKHWIFSCLYIQYYCAVYIMATQRKQQQQHNHINATYKSIHTEKIFYFLL